MESNDLPLLCCVFCIVGTVVKLAVTAVWKLAKLLLWTMPKAIYQCYRRNKNSRDKSSVDGPETSRNNKNKNENEQSNNLSRTTSEVSISSFKSLKDIAVSSSEVKATKQLSRIARPHSAGQQVSL
ncbi:hypothetical protein D920_01689 [Enterococcus faecalis 13-SD-W-01]|nr:hypothetical protein D920_01689 [Enterococcus faecalis 13-SD-W-01]